MEWIRVKGRLPEAHLKVLTWDCNYIEIMEYWYDEDDKRVWFSDDNGLKNYITHWMPLPQPPKE